METGPPKVEVGPTARGTVEIVIIYGELYRMSCKVDRNKRTGLIIEYLFDRRQKHQSFFFFSKCFARHLNTGPERY